MRARRRAFLIVLLGWVGLFVVVTIAFARARGSFQRIADDPPIVLAIIGVVLVVVIVVASLARRGGQQRVHAATGQQRTAWAHSVGWSYHPRPREIPPDALSEVETSQRADPIRITDEATGQHRGRRAFVHSRDTWVRVMSRLDTSRREVVGVEARIELPRTVVLTRMNAAGARTVRVQPAVGLSRVPQPFGTSTALFTPAGLEAVIATALRPALEVRHEDWLKIVCVGRWVLISADRDASTAAALRRLDLADHVAGLLEAGATG
ncbi:hypothetical protein [Ruania zhangjianzhongii]|uniref:hypothetical protein n=1 Tax=Ruania zhangjianzhongii TaxID=2603206 RepID=UPI0011C86734|nr:hypothetical protein [Ruania zhangjianzhongii]